MSKLIYADESLKRINEIMPKRTDSDYKKGIAVGISMAKIAINEQEGVDAVPVSWINKNLEWLDNCDNGFAQLAKVSIRAMLELWRKDGMLNEKTNLCG